MFCPNIEPGVVVDGAPNGEAFPPNIEPGVAVDGVSNEEEVVVNDWPNTEPGVVVDGAPNGDGSVMGDPKREPEVEVEEAVVVDGAKLNSDLFAVTPPVDALLCSLLAPKVSGSALSMAPKLNDMVKERIGWLIERLG